MKGRIGAAALVLAIGAFAAGCGGGGEDEKGEEAEHSTTPARALVEIGKVRSGLAEALATYKGGDRAAADELVGDAYLEHFELVEGPLEAVDGELTEELEDGIREELRDKLKAGAPVAEVEALVDEIDTNLDKAEAALQ